MRRRRKTLRSAREGRPADRPGPPSATTPCWRSRRDSRNRARPAPRRGAEIGVRVQPGDDAPGELVEEVQCRGGPARPRRPDQHEQAALTEILQHLRVARNRDVPIAEALHLFRPHRTGVQCGASSALVVDAVSDMDLLALTAGDERGVARRAQGLAALLVVLRLVVEGLAGGAAGSDRRPRRPPTRRRTRPVSPRVCPPGQPVGAMPAAVLPVRRQPIRHSRGTALVVDVPEVDDAVVALLDDVDSAAVLRDGVAGRARNRIGATVRRRGFCRHLGADGAAGHRDPAGRPARFLLRPPRVRRGRREVPATLADVGVERGRRVLAQHPRSRTATVRGRNGER